MNVFVSFFVLELKCESLVLFSDVWMWFSEACKMDPDFPRIIIPKSPYSFNWKPLGHLKVSANLVFQDSFSEFLGLKI